MSTGRAKLTLTDVAKSFGGVRALRGVDFEVRAGEVHALLGENGAGKSTLMAIAAGVLEPDHGTVAIDGVQMGKSTPSAAQALGVGVVYQHPAVADDLTVVENMLLAVPRDKRPKFGEAPDWASAQLRELGASIDPHSRVGELTSAENQLIEIAKVLVLSPKVLILDEPTAALGAAEVEHLFEQVRRIRSAGTAVVYISHRIPEVTAIADRLTVLRDGRYQGTFEVSALSEDDILELIVGRELSALFPEKSKATEPEPVISLDGLSGSNFDDVSFEVGAGEIVGLAGVIGNGQRELIRAMAGLEASEGTIQIDGKDSNLSSSPKAKAEGVAYVPGDRQREGMFESLSVRENAAAGALSSFSRGPFVSPGLERRGVNAELAELAVKTESPEAGISTLSGGNQQKVIFARSLLSEPSVLLCDEPTQGVDVGARAEIYRLLRSLADRGKAVVVCSSDAVELEGLCDRVIIMSRGSVISTLSGDEISEEAITGAAVKSSQARRVEPAREVKSSPRLRGRGRISRLFSGDNVATPVIAVVIALLAIFTYTQNSEFLGFFNINNVLLLSTGLILVSLGQLTTLLTGGVDLSVGPMMGLGLVILTNFATDERGLTGFLIGLGLLLVAGVIVGIVNGSLIRVAKINPVIATLATFIAIQGVALLINPIPDGLLATSAFDTLSTSIGETVPVAFVLVVVVAIALQLILRRTRYGMALRAVGSSEQSAHRIGINVGWTVFSAYIVCGVFAALAAVMLAVQIGTGDATAGQNYTLQSIAAVVIGGASIYGGRGSFLGALLGAFLLTEIINALPFLQLGNAWQFWIPGGIILIAAAIYSRASHSSSDALMEEAG